MTYMCGYVRRLAAKACWCTRERTRRSTELVFPSHYRRTFQSGVSSSWREVEAHFLQSWREVTGGKCGSEFEHRMRILCCVTCPSVYYHQIARSHSSGENERSSRENKPPGSFSRATLPLGDEDDDESSESRSINPLSTQTCRYYFRQTFHRSRRQQKMGRRVCPSAATPQWMERPCRDWREWRTATITHRTYHR